MWRSTTLQPRGTASEIGTHAAIGGRRPGRSTNCCRAQDQRVGFNGMELQSCPQLNVLYGPIFNAPSQWISFDLPEQVVKDPWSRLRSEDDCTRLEQVRRFGVGPPIMLSSQLMERGTKHSSGRSRSSSSSSAPVIAREDMTNKNRRRYIARQPVCEHNPNQVRNQVFQYVSTNNTRGPSFTLLVVSRMYSWNSKDTPLEEYAAGCRLAKEA